MRVAYVCVGVGELYCGELLFPTHENCEHLHMMHRLALDYCNCSSNDGVRDAGRDSIFPGQLLARMNPGRRDKYFESAGEGVYVLRPGLGKDSRRAVERMVVLSDMLLPCRSTLGTTLHVCNYYSEDIQREVESNLCKCNCGCRSVLYGEQCVIKDTSTLYQEMFELCKQLLVINPADRISARDALKCAFLNK